MIMFSVLILFGTQALSVSGEEPTPSLKMDAATAVGSAEKGDGGKNPYALMSLDELMSVQVTSVTGLSQSWFTTPAAMYVITPEDIHNIGARSIAEALRIVPGMHVARIDARHYAISSRGFNGAYANKLQVLVDGRSVYEPIFAGVLWDQQDAILEDLQSIEVIRGPGATLWGANAVNGVVSITSKSTKDTLGVLLSGGLGTEERYFGQVRFGDAIDDATWFRIWAKYKSLDSSYDPTTGGSSPDQWDALHGGFRLDHEGPDHAVATIISEFHGSDHLHRISSEPIPNTHFGFRQEEQVGETFSGFLLGRLNADLEHDHGWQIQAYVQGRHSIDYGSRENSQLVDIDAKYHFKLGQSHDILTGVEWRYNHTRLDLTTSSIFQPEETQHHLITGFFQDTITLEPGRWFMMIGTKVEHNDFTGFEVQPNARLWWTPNEHQTIWASISRAVRTPNIVEDTIRATQAYADTGLLSGGPASGVYTPIQLVANKDLKSEELIAFEGGYRQQFNKNVSIDIAAFANRYNDLGALVATSPTTTQFQTAGSAESYGVELAAHWDINDAWSLDGSYSYFTRFSHNALAQETENDTPHHLFNIQTHYALNDQWQFNGALYFVSQRGGSPSSGYTPSPAYTRLDLGVTWKPTADLEISVWGQNLLDSHHLEYADPYLNNRPLEIQRSVYVQVTYRF